MPCRTAVLAVPSPFQVLLVSTSSHQVCPSTARPRVLPVFAAFAAACQP
jgi:hypothetical protein